MRALTGSRAPADTEDGVVFVRADRGRLDFVPDSTWLGSPSRSWSSSWPAPGSWAALSQTALYDGGITASAGMFILHGAVPYRDFWLLYGLARRVCRGGLGLRHLRERSPELSGGLSLLAARGRDRGRRLRSFIGDRVPAVPRVVLAAIAAVSPVYHIGPGDLAPWGLAMALALGPILAITRPGHRWLFAAGILVGLAGLARRMLVPMR